MANPIALDSTSDAEQTNHLFMPADHMNDLYGSKNPLIRFVHLSRLKAIIRQVPHQERRTLLDAGCGEGHLLSELFKTNPKACLFGIDITDVALEKAINRCPQAQLIKGSLLKTPFESGFFDVIVCTEVIEHVYEYQALFTELIRILKPQGSLIITFPNELLWTLGRLLLGRRPVKVPDHVNSFTPERMRRAVGLKLERAFCLPLPLPFFLSLNCLMTFKKKGL